MQVNLKPRFISTAGYVPLLIIAGMLVVSPCVASDVSEPSTPLGTEEEQKNYEYNLENRPDPFTPFISPVSSTNAPDPNEIIDDETTLSGMQLFEPGQLSLVAILMSGDSSLAMVEDVTGRGYFLKEGTLIGRRGVVSQIESQQVIITETAKTRAGKELVSTVTMRLNKEGDE